MGMKSTRNTGRARTRATAAKTRKRAAKPGSAAAKARAAKAKADAARRANGAKGGRPRRHRYAEFAASMQDPTEIKDALQLLPWIAKFVHFSFGETLAGRGHREHNRLIRSTARTIKALVGTERVRQAEMAIKASEGQRAAEQLAKARGESRSGGRTTAAPTTSRPIR